MNWIILTVLAQFLNAIVAIVDKQIVSDEKILPKPFVYAFYTCLIAGVWVVVYLFSLLPLPFDGLQIPSFENVRKPSLEVVALAILSAYAFFTALVSMFTALRSGDAADVVPVIGATSAVASFLLSYFFFDTEIAQNFTLGIVLLSIGTFLVSRFHFKIGTALTAVHAGIFFAIHYISIKGLFLTTSFDDGFFWSRIAFVFYALSLLMVPAFFEKIKEQTKVTTRSAGMLIFINKLVAGMSAILILKATDLGDVAVVQALGGIQYVFILLFGIIMSLIPSCAICPKETYHPDTILQKTLFVTVITLGFLVLFR